MKKFELTAEFKMVMGRKLFRIKALVDFSDVKAGDLGGFVEKEENLDHEGDAWVYGDAQVSGDARVSGNARVYGDARVLGDAWVYGDADYTTIKGFGSEYRDTTFSRQKDGTIGVVCGCFYGTLEQFREKVRNTHGTTKFAKEYLMIADLMEMHFDKEENKNEDTRNESEQ